MKNNWYVITGAPSSGKTTIIELLKKRGFDVVYEMARLYIDQEVQKGKTIEEIRKDEALFQRKILDLKINCEKNLSKNKVTFLDRGIPDSDAYNNLYGISNDDFLKEAIKKSSYKKVFLLDLLDYKEDYARIETREQQKQIHDLLEESYGKINTTIINVPVMPPEERVDFILKNL